MLTMAIIIINEKINVAFSQKKLQGHYSICINVGGFNVWRKTLPSIIIIIIIYLPKV